MHTQASEASHAASAPHTPVAHTRHTCVCGQSTGERSRSSGPKRVRWRGARASTVDTDTGRECDGAGRSRHGGVRGRDPNGRADEMNQMWAWVGAWVGVGGGPWLGRVGGGGGGAGARRGRVLDYRVGQGTRRRGCGPIASRSGTNWMGLS